MSDKAARWRIWSIVILYFIFAGIGLALQILAEQSFLDLGFAFVTILSLLVGSWVVIGAVIVSRHPRNPIGWILTLAISVWGIDSLVFGYVTYGVVTNPGSLPGVPIALFWQNWTGFPFSIFFFTLLFLYFPTGRPISTRWGRLTLLITFGTVLSLVVNSLSPETQLFFPSIANPLSVSDAVWRILNPFRLLGISMSFFAVLAAGFSLLLRMRNARGDERQQLKWFIYAAIFLPISIPFLFLGSENRLTGIVLLIGNGLLLIGFGGVAIATAFAIFKYRLYDIDILINRTQVYAVLTGTLILIYTLSVVFLQNLIRSLTGQESPIAIVASTLLISVLFQPLRSRVQAFIDRRFYRHKYDAARTLARFGSTIRDEVDSEALTSKLLDVVVESLQPQHVSLWMRPPG